MVADDRQHETRIRSHPVMAVPPQPRITFFFNGTEYSAQDGEMISAALFANGIHRFGSHRKDGAAQGIFCANGQCAQCMVVADGRPVKACITPVRDGMQVRSLDGVPVLPADDSPVEPAPGPVPEVAVDVLIAGGGPAGLNAAIELAAGAAELRVLLCDDKPDLGGKLTLQTHTFFGSVAACRAGTRGMDIGTQLAAEVDAASNVEVWLDAPIVGLFEDGMVGVVHRGRYTLVRPRVLLVATGAREKALTFPGCDLPGVYGAGAFQTLVNRDLVRSAARIFVVGGGNVGLIAAYHALQAGIDVVGVVEALPEVGGYKVHLDKLRRLGVPVMTSHTVVEATGSEHVEGVVVARVDDRFRPIAGTFRAFDADTVLVAVGLNPVNELTRAARRYQLPVFEAGDSAVIAEASAAMFSGKIAARRIMQELGLGDQIPQDWYDLQTILRSRPGASCDLEPPSYPDSELVYPVIRCVQKIPCDPCTVACTTGGIRLDGESILARPQWCSEKGCSGCLRCLAICPGLAITLVDRRRSPEGKAWVWLPWELPASLIEEGMVVRLTGFEGDRLGEGVVRRLKRPKWMDRRTAVAVEVDTALADAVAGIMVRDPDPGRPLDGYVPKPDDDVIVCLCERVTKGEIRRLIRSGVRDLNHIKAATRAGMGACGGKTCEALILQLFREAGVNEPEVRRYRKRPFLMEVPMRALLGIDPGTGTDGETGTGTETDPGGERE